MAEDSGIRIKWRVVEPPVDRASAVLILLGAGLAVFGAVAFFGGVLGTVLHLEGKRSPISIPFAIAGTLLVGFMLRSGIRLMYPAAARILPPFLIRVALWLAILMCVGIGVRVLGHIIADERFEDFDTAAMGYLLLICLWFGALQFLILFRMPQIARSLDRLDGAIL